MNSLVTMGFFDNSVVSVPQPVSGGGGVLIKEIDKPNVHVKLILFPDINEQNKNIVLELIDIRKGSKDEQNNDR